MTRQSLKTSDAIANFALIASGALLISASTEMFRGQPIAPLGVLTGAALIGAGVERDRRNPLTDSDYLAGLQEVLGVVEDGVRRLWKENKSTVKEVIPVNFLPEKYRSLFSAQVDRMIGEDWVSDFVKRSKLIVGVTRSGKTTWMLFEIADFFKRYPGGAVTICDLNYKKPDADGKVNDWLGLPRDRFIRVEYEEIRDAIESEWLELQRRRKLCMESTGTVKLQRRKLLIDEVIGIMNEAKGRDKLKPSGEPKDLPQLQRWIGDLFYQGLGYQMELTLGLQTLAVGENGLNLAMQEQLNVLLLGSSAVNIDNVSRLPTVQNADRLIEELKTIRKMPGCTYAAIVKTGDEVAVKVVPHIKPEQFELQLPDEPLSEVDRWWQQVYTEALSEWLYKLAAQYVSGKIKSPLKGEICPQFGVETRSNCPRYQKVKAAWEQAQSKFKEDQA